MMVVRRQYKNPPVEEAICEFRFKPGEEWDLTIPGKLHVELAGEYPGKPRQQFSVETRVELQGDPPYNISLWPRFAMVRLVTEDERRLVSVGPNILSIHMLKPYQGDGQKLSGGWEEFRARIGRALEAYWRVASPIGVHRVGIRYINKVVVPSPSVDPRDYLLCAPSDVPGLPDSLSSFVGRVEYLYDDGARLVVTHATAEPPEGYVAFLLDIDVILRSDELLGKDEALAKVEELRIREREAFESLITDAARRLFDEG